MNYSALLCWFLSTNGAICIGLISPFDKTACLSSMETYGYDSMAMQCDLEEVVCQNCHEHADCVANECKCVEGYTGDGVTCSDLDECKDALLNNCDEAKEICNNLIGSFECQCLLGFIKIGTVCMQRRCSGRTIQSPSRTEKVYTFLDTDLGKPASSKETCSDGRPRATIYCYTVDDNGSNPKDIFNVSSLREIDCNENLETVLEKLKSTSNNNGTTNVEQVASSVTALSQAENVTKEDIAKTIDIMENLAANIEQEKKKITPPTFYQLVETASNIHESSSNVHTPEPDGEKSEILKTNFFTSMELFSANLDLPSSNPVLRVETKFVSTQVVKIGNGSFANVTYAKSLDICKNSTSCHAYASVPASALEKARDKGVKDFNVAFLFYSDNNILPALKEDQSNYEVQNILSATVSSQSLTSLSEPVEYEIPTKQSPNNTIEVTRCGYLNNETNKWSFDGCRCIPHTRPTKCECDHTTNFAVIVQRYDTFENFALGIFGTVASYISIASLVLLLIIYIRYEKVRKNQINQLHIQLALCLALSNLVMVTGIERTNVPSQCIISTAFLHFFMLSTWGWMTAECVTMYKKFVAIFSHISSKHILYCATVVYGMSGFISVVTVAVGVMATDKNAHDGWCTENEKVILPSSYTSGRFCWLHGQSLNFAFLLPVGTMFLVNTFGLAKFLHVIVFKRMKVRSNQKRIELKDHITRAFSLMVLLGSTWIFAIPLTLTDDQFVNVLFGWLFSIFNGLQGLLLFLMLCIKREEVRILWMPSCGKIRTNLFDGTGYSISASEHTMSTTATESKIPVEAKKYKVLSHSTTVFQENENVSNDTDRTDGKLTNVSHAEQIDKKKELKHNSEAVTHEAKTQNDPSPTNVIIKMKQYDEGQRSHVNGKEDKNKLGEAEDLKKKVVESEGWSGGNDLASKNRKHVSDINEKVRNTSQSEDELEETENSEITPIKNKGSIVESTTEKENSHSMPVKPKHSSRSAEDYDDTTMNGGVSLVIKKTNSRENIKVEGQNNFTPKTTISESIDNESSVLNDFRSSSPPPTDASSNNVNEEE